MRVMPSPSIEIKPSISAWSRNSALTPRRLPSSSSPTVPTNSTSPTVLSSLAFMAWISDSSAASPRESSPMPGARMTPSFSFTVTSVPSGNTVSRCADTTSFGPPPLPLRKRDHIALGVDRGVLEAEFDKAFQVIFRPDLLLVGRRRNFGDALLLGKRPGVIGLDVVKRLDDFGMCEDRGVGRLDSRAADGVWALTWLADNPPTSKRPATKQVRLCLVFIALPAPWCKRSAASS